MGARVMNVGVTLVVDIDGDELEDSDFEEGAYQMARFIYGADFAKDAWIASADV